MPSETTKKQLKLLLTAAQDKIEEAIDFVDEHAAEFADNADDMWFGQLLIDAEETLEKIENDLKG